MLRWSRDKDRDKAGRGAAADAGTGMFRTHARPVRPLEEARGVRDAVAPGEGSATLEDILLSEGTVTADELKNAQAVQAKEGGFLGQILIDLGYIDANSLTSFLAKHCKIPHLSLLDYLIDETQVKSVPRDICLKYRLLPIDRLGKNLTVAMVNPLDSEALEEVRKACPDLRVKPILCEYSHFEAVARRLFKIEADQSEVSMDTLGLTEPASARAPEQESVPAPPAAEPDTAGAPLAAADAPAAPLPPAADDSRVAGAHEPAPTTHKEDAHSEASPASAPAPATAGFDDEAVLEAFFGVVADDAEADADASQSEPSAPARSSVLQEMVAIMGDSMRDTYGMLARKLALFAGLSSEQVAKIFAKGITAEFEEGQTVFHEGDAGEDLYVILGGSVAIQHDGVETARLVAGDAFGEAALFSHEPRNATAVAVETSSVLVLNEKVIRKVLDKDTALHLLGNLVVSLSRRLRQRPEPH